MKEVIDFLAAKASRPLAFLRHASSDPLPPPHHPILILDSSFNPPTRAHMRLILLALARHSYSSVLLLHATTNADKGSPDIPDIHRRVQFMRALASDLSAHLASTSQMQPNQPPSSVTGSITSTATASTTATTPLHPHAPPSISLALTVAPRFIEKSTLLRSLRPNYAQHWILGLDTLVRLVDAKYYTVPPREALSSLFSYPGDTVLCFAREVGGGATSASPLPELAQELETEGRVVWMGGWNERDPLFSVSSTKVRALVDTWKTLDATTSQNHGTMNPNSENDERVEEKKRAVLQQLEAIVSPNVLQTLLSE
ncbi:hypothetical protein BC830DRAFT_1216051 [Chytriomyces sp. MP71]|nr:hypothetical protein BC830DRAFT_1216051 [Chytriomyces sp. MP71]